jgi:flagellar biosynthesis component FlhA
MLPPFNLILLLYLYLLQQQQQQQLQEQPQQQQEQHKEQQQQQQWQPKEQQHIHPLVIECRMRSVTGNKLSCKRDWRREGYSFLFVLLDYIQS